MIKTIIYLPLFLLFSCGLQAQNIQPGIFPEPQKVQLSAQRFQMKIYHISGDLTPDAEIISLLKRIFKFSQTSKELTLEISQADKSDTTLNQSGAYRLILSPEKIIINAIDQRGLYYAVQTLQQLAKYDSGMYTLPTGEITDFPDVTHRGTVEGFYGEPWTFQDRLEQLRFYGKLKLNTYIYGPKDDPFHSSPNWRLPYPEEEAAKIKNLVKTADSNYVDFVWAIHPGLDIQWTMKDSLAVLHKFELMYKLGVRNFAVFFDDISGVGTDAHKQAALLNYIQNSFVKVKKDVGPLIMCPTEYNKSWSNKTPGTYLDILGTVLDPAVHIMWTGNKVVADINKVDLEWVNTRIQRPAFVWWNFPVSDYVRDHLLMGPSYGLDPNAAKEMSGFVSNPMDKSEASKVAIFGVAMYSWNMKSYNPQQAWIDANKYIMPEAHEEFILFNSHNSDLGPNGHGYRRDESVIIKPIIDSFLNLYKSGTFDTRLFSKIQNEFTRITLTPEIIQSRSSNRRLIEQIQPWLTQFEWLGKSGLAALELVEKLNNNQDASAWNAYLKVKNDLDSMDMVDKKYNQNPYQPGVKTGSLVLTPFVKELFESGGYQILNPGKKLAEIPVASISKYASAKFTNNEKLKDQPLQLTNFSVAYSPVLESLSMHPEDYFGIHLAQNLKATSISFNFKSNSLKKWGAMEWSLDGVNWAVIEFKEKNGKGTIDLTSTNLKFIRFFNHSKEFQDIFLTEFKVMVEAANEAGQQTYALDGNIHTFETFSNQKSLRIDLAEKYKNTSLIILIEKNENDILQIAASNVRGREKIFYRGKANYILLEKKKLRSINSIILSTNNALGKLYEVVPVQ